MSNEVTPLDVEDYATQHIISVRFTTADAPDLKKILSAVAKLGSVRSLSYDNY